MSHMNLSKLGHAGGRPSKPLDEKTVELPRPRAPAGRNFQVFLDGLGIRDVHKNAPRGMKNAIYGGRYVKRLWLSQEQFTWTTLRSIQISNPFMFEDVVIWGVYRFVSSHAEHVPSHECVLWFRSFDIERVVTRAKQICHGPKTPMVALPKTISVLLADIIMPKELAD